MGSHGRSIVALSQPESLVCGLLLDEVFVHVTVRLHVYAEQLVPILASGDLRFPRAVGADDLPGLLGTREFELVHHSHRDAVIDVRQDHILDGMVEPQLPIISVLWQRCQCPLIGIVPRSDVTRNAESPEEVVGPCQLLHATLE
jgi:hypothetical protein